jgi:hypothetical protein
VTLHFVGKRNITLLQGSQASPSSPSDKGSMEVKMLGWLEAVASDRGSGILVY